MARYRLVGGSRDGQWWDWTGSQAPPRQVRFHSSPIGQGEAPGPEDPYDRVTFMLQGQQTVHLYAPPELDRNAVLRRLIEGYKL